MGDTLSAAYVIFMILVAVGFLQLFHWIALKILRKPKMGFRKWITSWIAGPELFLGGLLLLIIFHILERDVQFLIVLATFIECLGILVFIIKIIVSIITRVYWHFTKNRAMHRPLEYGPHLSAAATQQPLRFADNASDATNDPETI
jgi:hypothetical protein